MGRGYIYIYIYNTSLYIKLEEFIIYHYIQPEMPPNLASPPRKTSHQAGRGEGKKEKLKKKKTLSEPQQQPMGKINMQIYSRN